MDGVHNTRRTIVQGNPIIYSKMLNDGQFAEGKT
jgi:hypothetical protein